MRWWPWQKDKNNWQKYLGGEKDQTNWTNAHKSLMSNKTYSTVYNDVEANSEIYNIKQVPYTNFDTGGNIVNGEFDSKDKTIELRCNVPTSRMSETLFEEVFHAGQNTSGSKNTRIENEVEAKFAAVVAGVGKDEFNIQNNAKEIISILKSGKSVDAKTINKNNEGINMIYNAVLERYKDFGWSKSELKFNPNKFLNYLNKVVTK